MCGFLNAPQVSTSDGVNDAVLARSSERGAAKNAVKSINPARHFSMLLLAQRLSGAEPYVNAAYQLQA